MSRTRAFPVLLCTLAALSGLPGPGAAQHTAPAPRIEHRARTLANGLRVVSVQDLSTPSVTVGVWYGIGSRDDPPGRNGFAHLFEHLLFQGSRNLPPDAPFRMAEEVGSTAQSIAGADVVGGYQTVPSAYLETFLWAEADRLRSLELTEEILAQERAAIEGEIRNEVTDPPYGRLPYLLEQESFARHPYRNVTIGRAEELGAATTAEVRDFLARLHRPDNAVLVVVGSFEPRRLDAWVDRHFAGIPRPAGPVPRAAEVEPERAGERRVVEYGRHPQPVVALMHLIPPVSHADLPALRVARTLLAGDASARLTRSLVQEQRVASRTFSNLLLRAEPGSFFVGGYAGEGRTAEEVERALAAEMDRLRAAPVPEAELERARTTLVAEWLRQTETGAGTASALAQAVLTAGDPGHVNTWIEQARAVTAEDVRRVAERYLTDANRVVLHYLPEQMRPAADGTARAEDGR